MNTIKKSWVSIFGILMLSSLIILNGCGGGGGGSSGTTTTTTAPSAPSDVTATAGDGQVVISWNSVSGATSYSLYMATQSGVTKSNYTTLTGGMKHADITTTSYTHTGLTNGTTYYFVVTAVNSSGESTESSEVSAVKAKSVSITTIGLGESILVTNTSPVAISGLAESDIGIEKVEYFNQTTNTTVTAQGTTNWTANISLSEGENKIYFYAYAKDGTTKAEISTTITYYQNLDFTTSLTFSAETLYVNESKDVTFTIGIKSGTNATVTLHNTNTSGSIQSEAGTMKDDGVLPDEIQTDGIYTSKLTLTPSQAGYMCYKVGVIKTSSNPYYSENKCIWVTSHYTNDNVSKAVSLADSVKTIFDNTLKKSGTLQKSFQDAAKAAVEQLKNDPSIGAVDSTDEGGIWWITNDGILGIYHPTVSGVISGTGINKRFSTKTSMTPTYKPEVKTVYYPAEYLLDRSNFVPSYLSKKASKIYAPSSNEIKSTKAIIISPYSNDLGQNYNHSVIWDNIKNKKACNLQPSKEVLQGNANLDTFKKLGDYGYIQIYTHGDNFYNGLLSLWQDKWGPNSFLKGSLSQVVLWTHIILPKKGDGTYDLTGYEDDVKEKRIAIGPDGTIAILPAFIKYYTDKLPNSLVILTACRSMYNNSMANAFLSKGAGAIVGYSEYVLTDYARKTGITIADELIAGKTIKEAIDKAIATHGAFDDTTMDKNGDGNADPAYLKYTGSDTLVLSGGGLKNGGFEDGVLSPWSVSGDGRIITQLGITSPTEGSYMGIISTGLGYTTESGEIQQDFCASTTSKQLSFNWDFFSEEFKEYCGSIYQDTFKVLICTVDDSTGAESCDVVLDKKIDDLCSSVTASDVKFDQDGVYNTGWLSQLIDFSQYAGKHIRLKFYATDVGDSIFDSAILVDKIEISEQ